MTTPDDQYTSQARRDREEYPTGWMALIRHRSIGYMIDALLDLPPRREVTQTELAELAGVSRQSVNTHIDFLVEVGVVEPVADTSPQRYRLDRANEVTQALVELDATMNRAGPHVDGEA